MKSIQNFNGAIGTRGIADEGGVTSPFLNAETVEVSGSAKINEIIPYGLMLTTSGDECTVTGYTGSARSLSIPAFYNGKPVIGIGAGVFQNNTTLKEINLPSGIQQIENNAFAGSGLTTVTIEATEVPVTGTTAFPVGVTLYVPYTALSAYTTAWGSYGTVKAKEFNGIAEKAKTADTAASAVNATNATNATNAQNAVNATAAINAENATNAEYAKYASEDTTKGTIEERLTNLGFKETIVTLAGVPVEIYKQGNIVWCSATFETNMSRFIKLGELQVIGTMPPELRPTDVIMGLFQSVEASTGSGNLPDWGGLLTITPSGVVEPTWLWSPSDSAMIDVNLNMIFVYKTA